MKILENHDLTNLNTFGVTAKAKFFVELKNENEIQLLFKSDMFKNNKKIFLGKGSNVLFTNDFDGIVVQNSLKGIEILEEYSNYNNEEVYVKAAAGEIWHDLVSFTIEKGYWGLENLSLVPGTVGAAPIQNIGAYGVEIKDVLENLESYEIETGEKKIFMNSQCNFGYRESIFKNEFKGKYFISNVVLKLNKKEKKNIEYKILAEYIKKNGISIESSKNVSDAVSTIRKSKLPDPTMIGNAGSFFKNVFLEKSKFKEFQEKYPSAPFFDEGDFVKIPTAWLVEQCGWKGKKVGNAGIHEKQALVLVNLGGATGLEIKELSDKIAMSVLEKFGLKLEREVNIIS